MHTGAIQLIGSPLIERYEFKASLGKDFPYKRFFDFLFYRDIIRIDRYVAGNLNGKELLLSAGSGYCMFDADEEALYILNILSPNIDGGEQSGTFALKRLEEIAKEKGLKRIDVVDGKNHKYWEDQLGFHKTTSRRIYNDGSRKTIDFVKPITKKAEGKYPPISTRHEFRLISKKPVEAEEPSYDLERFNNELIRMLVPHA